MPGAPETSGDSALVQERVALLAWVLVLLSSAGLVINGAVDTARGHPELVLSPGYAPTYLATAVFVGAWAMLRRGWWSQRVVRMVEIGSLLANSALAALSGRFIDETLIPWMAATPAEVTNPVTFALLARWAHHYMALITGFSLSLIVVLRAALVPGSTWYAVVLTLVSGTPLLVTSGAGYVPYFTADYVVRAALTPTDRWAGVTMMAIWWGFTVTSCGIIANVIHGLRSEVREARRLGQYYLLEKLGEGGMGQVFRARHALLRRPTAVKLLLPNRTRSSDLARFEREVQQTARLTHPNTITIYDYGRTSDGVFYYAMELLEGATLEDAVRHGGPMPPGRVARILRMVVGALAEAHDICLVHRDIKPANLFLCSRGGSHDVVKVLDFGLVKELASNESMSLTRDGALQGTPLYMAPEVISKPETLDARSDIYALGGVAYFMLTGRPPFVAKTVVEVCAHHLHSTPQPPSAHLGTALPPALEALVLQCLAKQPDQRPASANVILDQLEAMGDLGWSDSDARQWWAQQGPLLVRQPRENVDATVPIGETDVTMDAA